MQKQSYTGQELVSYSQGELTSGGNSLGAFNHCNDYYHQWHDYYYPIYYPTYHICEKSKVEQGFRVVAKMIENKIIEKELTIKEFIKLVNDIAEIL